MKEKKINAALFYRKYGIVLILVLLFLVSALVNHNFLKPRNLINILTQISVVTIIACGEEMLIVSGPHRFVGGTDLYRFCLLRGGSAGRDGLCAGGDSYRPGVRRRLWLGERLSGYQV